MKGKNVVVVTLGGYYWWGKEVAAPEGYIKLEDAGIVGTFGGGLGISGVTAGSPQSTATIWKAQGTDVTIPISSVCFIADVKPGAKIEIK